MADAIVYSVCVIGAAIYSASMVYFFTNYQVVVRSQRSVERWRACEARRKSDALAGQADNGERVNGVPRF